MANHHKGATCLVCTNSERNRALLKELIDSIARMSAGRWFQALGPAMQMIGHQSTWQSGWQLWIAATICCQLSMLVFSYLFHYCVLFLLTWRIYVEFSGFHLRVGSGSISEVSIIVFEQESLQACLICLLLPVSLCVEWRCETDNGATIPIVYCSSTASLPLRPHCVNARWIRCQADLISFTPPENWRRPSGRPHSTWMKTIQQDLKSMNLSVNEAINMAQNRPLWRLMSTFGATHS